MCRVTMTNESNPLSRPPPPPADRRTSSVEQIELVLDVSVEPRRNVVAMHLVAALGRDGVGVALRSLVLVVLDF